MLDDRDKFRQLTWDMIAKHKAIIDEMWDKFRNLAYQEGDKPGEHAIYFMTSHPDCEIVKITITNQKAIHERKSKSPEMYYLMVGIEFKSNWSAAHSSGMNQHMRAGTLEAIGKYAREEQFFERAHEGLFKEIEKYFYGD